MKKTKDSKQKKAFKEARKELRKGPKQIDKKLKQKVEELREETKERFKEPQPIEVNLGEIMKAITPMMQGIMKSNFVRPNKIIQPDKSLQGDIEPYRKLMMSRQALEKDDIRAIDWDKIDRERKKQEQVCEHNWHYSGQEYSQPGRYAIFICDKCGRTKQVLIK